MITRLLQRAFSLVLVIFAAAGLSQPSAAASPCEPQTFASQGFVVCTVDPRTDDLRLFWQDGDGNAFRTFGAVSDQLEAGGERLVFGMNAGMYLPDFSPMGLYVEAGKELRPPNISEVAGPPAEVPNFYKKPNGIFFLTASGAGIVSTEEYLRLEPEARFATQSGPMLVIANALHPALIEGSTDRRKRSGVGVCDGDVIRFAISDGAVNFHDFALLFRDHLRCPDALYLDGGRGAGLYDPELRRNDFSWHGGFGPMFGLVQQPS